MNPRKIFAYVVLAAFAGGFLVLINQPPEQLSVDARENAKVLKAIDGDTIEVSIDSKKERVRMIGIDTPEIFGDQESECFAKEASEKTKELLEGKKIVLESDSTQHNRDEYGRLLRYVFLERVNINEALIEEGYAKEYTFKGIEYKYQSDFIEAARGAKENNKGLWGKC